MPITRLATQATATGILACMLAVLTLVASSEARAQDIL